MHFVFKSLFIHDAFTAFNFVTMSTIPMPRSLTGAIRVFLFILSVLFHIKLKINLFTFFKYSSSGKLSIDPRYINLDIARVLTTQHYPKIVSFLFFHDSNNFSIFPYTFIQFLL